MSLSNALSSSVSGLDAASTSISVIGDNIANSGTTGFKEKRVEFASILGQNISAGAGFSQVGAGVRVNNIGTIFSQGTFTQTGRTTDLGIEGRGFFVLEGNQGRAYTRAGIFGFDANDTLVDAAGSLVQGYSIDPTTGTASGVIGDIQMSQSLAPPSATTSMQLSMNLDARSTEIPAGFDPADEVGTSTTRETIRIHDSLGGERDATIFFTKTAPNTWEYNVTLSDGDSGAPTGNPYVVQGGAATGTLVFDSAGELQSINGGTADPAITFNFETSNGNAPSEVVTLNFGPIAGVGTGRPTTQFQEVTSTGFVSQDGYGAGTLVSLEIDESGFMNGVFSNGVTAPIAQLALANFGNVEGLTDIGNTKLIESVASGPPLISGANSGNLGRIRSSSLEQSNVDLAEQFVKLIVSQRAFQANTRTVSVANELMGNLVNLGQ